MEREREGERKGGREETREEEGRERKGGRERREKERVGRGGRERVQCMGLVVDFLATNLIRYRMQWASRHMFQ